ETSPMRMSPELGEALVIDRASVEITGTQELVGRVGLDEELVKEEPLSPEAERNSESETEETQESEPEPESEPVSRARGLQVPAPTPATAKRLTPSSTEHSSITRNKAGRAVFNPTPVGSPAGQ